MLAKNALWVSTMKARLCDRVRDIPKTACLLSALLAFFLGFICIYVYEIPVVDAVASFLYVPLVIFLPGCALAVALIRDPSPKPTTVLASGFFLGMLFAGTSGILATLPLGSAAHLFPFLPCMFLVLPRVRSTLLALCSAGLSRIANARLITMVMFSSVFLLLLMLTLLFYVTPGFRLAYLDFHASSHASYMVGAFRSMPVNLVSMSGHHQVNHYNLWGHFIGTHLIRLTGVSVLSFVSNGVYLSFLPVLFLFWILLLHALGMRGFKLAYTVFLLCAVDCSLFRIYEQRLFFPQFLGISLLLGGCLLDLDDRPAMLVRIVRWIVAPIVLVAVSLPGGMLLLGGQAVLLLRRLRERDFLALSPIILMILAAGAAYAMFFLWGGRTDGVLADYYGFPKPYQLFAFARGYSGMCARFQDAWMAQGISPALIWHLSAFISAIPLFFLHLLPFLPLFLLAFLTKRSRPLSNAEHRIHGFAIFGYAAFSVIDLPGVSQSHMLNFGFTFLMAGVCLRWSSGEYRPWFMQHPRRRLLSGVLHAALVLPLLVPPVFFPTHGINRRVHLFAPRHRNSDGFTRDREEVIPYLPHESWVTRQLFDAVEFIRRRTPRSAIVVSPDLVFPREIEKRWAGCGRSHMITALTERVAYFESSYGIVADRDERIRRLRVLRRILDEKRIDPELTEPGFVFLFKRPTFEALSEYGWDVHFDNPPWVVATYRSGP